MHAPPRAFILGHPVAQSRSPMIHGYWLKTMGIDGAYDFQDVTTESLPTFFEGLRAAGYVGGNVTAPHKSAGKAAPISPACVHFITGWMPPCCALMPKTSRPGMRL